MKNKNSTDLKKKKKIQGTYKNTLDWKKRKKKS